MFSTHLQTRLQENMLMNLHNPFQQTSVLVYTSSRTLKHLPMPCTVSDMMIHVVCVNCVMYLQFIS